jgi:hypothetical protein
VTAPIAEAQLAETVLLNHVTFQTAVASKAARCVLAAGDAEAKQPGCSDGEDWAMFTTWRSAGAFGCAMVLAAALSGTALAAGCESGPPREGSARPAGDDAGRQRGITARGDRHARGGPLPGRALRSAALRTRQREDRGVDTCWATTAGITRTWCCCPRPGQAAELDRARAEQWSLTRTAACVFRPPSGDYDATTLRLAQQRRMGMWLWSVDTQDWMADGLGSSYWVQRIIRLAEAEGAKLHHPVVLMHTQTIGNPATVSALPVIIQFFRSHGYTFVAL